jgi:hypothetical protein
MSSSRNLTRCSLTVVGRNRWNKNEQIWNKIEKTQAQKARWKEDIHIAAVLFIPRDTTRESQGTPGQISSSMSQAFL